MHSSGIRWVAAILLGLMAWTVAIQADEGGTLQISLRQTDASKLKRVWRFKATTDRPQRGQFAILMAGGASTHFIDTQPIERTTNHQVEVQIEATLAPAKVPGGAATLTLSATHGAGSSTTAFEVKGTQDIRSCIKLIEAGPADAQKLNRPVRILRFDGADILIMIGEKAENWAPKKSDGERDGSTLPGPS